MNSTPHNAHRSPIFTDVPGLEDAALASIREQISSAQYDGSNGFYDGKHLHISVGSTVRPAFPGVGTHNERWVLAGVRLCHILGIKGANKRWKLETLTRKIGDERQRLIDEIQRRKLPGCNLASTWGPHALVRKVK